MTNHEKPGFFRRLLAATGDVLARSFLGKSAPSYVKQLSGSDAYWDRALAAQLGWPQTPTPGPAPDQSRSSGTAAPPARPGVRDTAQGPPGPEPEPIPGRAQAPSGRPGGTQPGPQQPVGEPR
jgi:hypothetical protein